MNILILGATSQIGANLAVEFSQENILFLVGRNIIRLKEVKNQCMSNKAESVVLINQDIGSGIDCIVKEIGCHSIDVFINAASAVTRLRDADTKYNNLGSYLMVDVIAPIELVQLLSRKNGDRKLDVIFISTFLTLVRSPNRIIYTSLKLIQENFLQQINNATDNINLTIVKICKTISVKKETDNSKRLATTIVNGFKEKKRLLYFGKSGILLTLLFYIQPILFLLVTFVQRKIRMLMSRNDS